MIPAARILLWSIVPIPFVAACDTSPRYQREEGRRRHLESLGVDRFDSGGTYPLAGVSTMRRIEIAPLDPGKLRGDTLDPAYGVLLMRCGACHDVPDPDSKPAYLWGSVVSRMRKDARDAGLMPMDSSDEAAVLRFLREHAAGGRGPAAEGERRAMAAGRSERAGSGSSGWWSADPGPSSSSSSAPPRGRGDDRSPGTRGDPL